jgi:hypothetical protein
METKRKRFSRDEILKVVEKGFNKSTIEQVAKRYFKIIDYLPIAPLSQSNKGEYEIFHEKMDKLLSNNLKFLSGALNYCHHTDDVFDLVPEYIKQCDCEMKIIKNRNSKSSTSLFKDLSVVCNKPTTVEFAKLQIKEKKFRTEQLQKYDSYSFEVGVPPDYADQSRSKEEPMFSTCSSCNFINEYIDYDPEYKCLKCRNGW